MKSVATDILDRILSELASDAGVSTKESLAKLVNRVSGETGLSGSVPTLLLSERYRALVKEGRLPEDSRVKRVLRRRAVRSLSGVSVVSLLTPNFPCPGKCVYCPDNPGLPKSYVPGEPAVMRAEANAFDPVKQVWNRLRALSITGHSPEKCDVRIIGGSWGAYPKDFREDFVRKIYDAHTLFSGIPFESADASATFGKHLPFVLPKDVPTDYSESLGEAQDRNSRAENRVVGMAAETRPDLVTSEELRFFRECGITRVEIGYQTTVDEINFATGRGHGNAESAAATKALKDAGFKVVAHMMPNLPGSDPETDRQSFFRVWDDPDFRPDEIKIYPTVVVGNSALERLWKAGKFVPYSDEVLVPLMADLEAAIPEYARLNRAYRDIPASEILSGSKMANLRQVTEAEMHVRGEDRKDISAREVRDKKNDPSKAVLEIAEYEASGGREYFLQFVDSADRTLFSVLRFRIPSWTFDGGEPIFDCLSNSALIREIHTYGDQMGIGETGGNSQHRGFGKRLLEEAERIVREAYPQLENLAVIAGAGTREYYAKRGFGMSDLGYMSKRIGR